MKKRIIRIIATALVAFSAFSFISCSDSEESSSGGGNNPTLAGVNVNNEQAKGTVSDYQDHFVTGGQLHKINVTESNRPFATNGKSEYKIVIGAGNTDATNAKTKAAWIFLPFRR